MLLLGKFLSSESVVLTATSILAAIVETRLGNGLDAAWSGDSAATEAAAVTRDGAEAMELAIGSAESG